MKFFSTLSFRPVSTNQQTAKLRIDHLEYRLTPSAFGPADGAYIVESWNGRYNDVKIQPSDQKIVAAGSMAGSSTMMAIARYDSQGNTDIAFGSNGVTSSTLGGTLVNGQGLTLQADGKAIVSGYWGGTLAAKHFVARFKTNGTFDSSYGGGGWTTVDFDPTYLGISGLGTAVALQSTGKAVIASFENTSYGTQAVVARFATSGSLDSGKSGFGTVVQGKAIGYTLSTFGAGNSNYLGDLVVQADDKIVAVGVSTTDGNGPFLMARYTANGTLDTTFNATGFTTFLPSGSISARAYGVTRQTDGKIVVVGSCTEIGATDTNGSWDMLVARFNANGSVDPTFGAGNGYVRVDIDGDATITKELGKDLVIQPDGKIVAVGQESDWNQADDNPRSILVARLNTDGTPDLTFGNGGFKIAAPPAGHNFSTLQQGVALQSNGNIIVAGSDNDGTSTHPLLMRFYGTTNPLNATSTPTTTNTQTITLPQAQPLLTEAIARWQSAGFNVSSLGNINLRIADLPGTTLGQAQGNTITLDSNAAGWGWFVDKTPRSDSEFRLRGNQGEQGRMDLLTVLIHETGHLLGRGHSDHGLMADTLAAGQRLSPSSATDAAFLLRELSQFSKSRRTDW